MDESNGINQVTQAIIGSAIKVHRALGPGLLEAAYEACLVAELMDSGHEIERQRTVPVVYEGRRLDCGFRLDLLVAKSVIVEIKAVDAIAPIHQAQLLTYLKLTGLKVGLIINFNVLVLRHGIKRMINGIL